MKKIGTKRIKGIVASIAVLAFAVCAFVIGFAAAPSARAENHPFAGGSGTARDPYVVATANQFYRIREYSDRYFVQAGHLDFSEYAAFEPIGSKKFPFTGTYDGGQYEITNLRIDCPEDESVGLFGMVLNGTVENVRVKSGSIAGKANVGAIAGTNKGTVKGCFNYAEIRASEMNAGGIAGLNSLGATLANCGNFGSVVANTNAGGITGGNYAKIANCFNSAKIRAVERYVGGIAGINSGLDGIALIQNAYDLGEQDGDVKGAVAGDNWSGNIYNTLWHESSMRASAFDTGDTASSRAVSTADFNRAETFSGWANFATNWMFFDGIKRPMLRCEYIPVREVTIDAPDRMRAGQSATVVSASLPVHATAGKTATTLTAGGEYASFDPAAGRLESTRTRGSARSSSCVLLRTA